MKFDVRSKDVIHDFWIPDFRMKIDAVPGITTSYRVTPKDSAIGDHEIVCAELCGLGHAFMRQTAHVLPSDKFDAFVQKASAVGAAAGAAAGGGAGQAAAGGGAPAVDAKALFTGGSASTGATAAARATRWPPRARRAPPAPSSTRCSRARTPRSSNSRSRTRPR